ncbi:hypothetical protein pEaSNUABM37_00005 [Erwinia phage pEa_SNUABM_37]|nr:hypothetical protein pEaSNUABM37_00005 [Erwinia phage pEa_SNUABM_37]QXO10475.1 hypothetical protein pEaSNUABM48_00005 [Erwinia phage pEa_SNUABM_48]
MSDKLITEEEKRAAEDLILNDPEYTNYFDEDWDSTHILLDGKFTIEQLEAAILLKRYTQQGK